jgi:phosphoribosylamine--glycine ligase
MKINALIIGSGAREHAFAWKIKQSPLIEKIYLAPGNGGTERQFINLPIETLEFDKIAKAILDLEIKLVLIGPEQPLVDGIVDFFENQTDSGFKDVVFVGPNKMCAALEGSKDFSKKIMNEAGIPTAKAKVFFASDWQNLKAYIENHPLPVVIKADGLAAGKGVAVCTNHEEAIQFASSVLIEKEFGENNQSLLVEEFLDGIEVSMFLLSDGENYQLLPSAKDYKRIFDQDKGPNTGGMGSVSPVWFVDSVFTEKVETRIIKPLFQTMKKHGMNYTGFLFIGLMKVGQEPIVIEFNARMGDPETQSVLARIDGDFVPALLSIKNKELYKHPIRVVSDFAVTVVHCAENYPEKPTKGDAIQIDASLKNQTVFHAGTQKSDNILLTNGGRVISCTGLGGTLDSATSNAYDLAKKIHFRGQQYRSDIGKDLMKEPENL